MVSKIANLISIERERSENNATFISRITNVIVDDISEHKHIEHEKTARHTIDSCKRAVKWTREDREPEMSVGHSTVSVHLNIALLLLASNW